MPNFHIQRGAKRTTVSIHKTTYELMAVKLGTIPNTSEAHKIVRLWLQKTSDFNDDNRQTRFSQWINQEAILFLVDKITSKKYWDWRIEEEEL